MTKVKTFKVRYIHLFLLVAGIFSIALLSFKPDKKEVQWVSFDDAVKLCKDHPKKIFIDVYTQWCGWCKRMDASTYKDAGIIDYLNKNFYCVRLDAETKDTFHFNNHVFVNPHPEQRGSVNELAYSLLGGKMGYPTTVYMDEKFNLLSMAQSYLDVASLKPILSYFAEDKYKTLTFDDYKKSLEAADSTKKAAN
jgi:thioredoxin-related protein